MAERKRATGFVLMDAAFALDPKFLRLSRQAKSPHDYAATVGVFWLLLADARRAKNPTIDWEDYDEYADEVAELQSVRLLQEGGFDAEVFERWAPAYKSPGERTQPYPSVPDRSGSTLTSGQVKSVQVTSNGVGGAGEGVFMGWKPKPGYHDGHHGPSCDVCAPLLPSEKGRPA